MGNFDKKFIKQRRKEEKQALKKQLKELKKEGVEITPEFKKKAEKAVRQYSIKQELSRRKRVFVRMGGKEENFNETDARREILNDFKEVENSRLKVRVASFLAAAGLTLGIGPKLLPQSTDEAKLEDNGYEIGDELEEDIKAIETEKNIDGSVVEQSSNEKIDSEYENLEIKEQNSSEEERNISEEVYFKLKDSSPDEIKEYCKNIYASIYQEKTGEEIDPEAIEIKQEYKGYSYNVTLPNGQNVIILHNGNPLETKEQLSSISGITYEKAVYENEPYHIIYQKTPEGSKLIDGSVGGKTITTVDNLKAVLRDEEQTINRSASNIPDNIWETMVLAMTGDKNLSNEQLIELSRWIRDNELEESVLGEQNELEEHTEVEKEALAMADETIESSNDQSKENSERKSFLEQLRDWESKSNTTPNSEKTQQKQNEIDDGR